MSIVTNGIGCAIILNNIIGYLLYDPPYSKRSQPLLAGQHKSTVIDRYGGRLSTVVYAPSFGRQNSILEVLMNRQINPFITVYKYLSIHLKKTITERK